MQSTGTRDSIDGRIKERWHLSFILPMIQLPRVTRREYARVRKIELRLDVAPENHLARRRRESWNVEFNWNAKHDENIVALEGFFYSSR